MNTASFSGSFARLRHRLTRQIRLLDRDADVNSFAGGKAADSIQRIYVINLDRKPDRWHQVSKELGRFRGKAGIPLLSISRRFSAVDARYMEGDPDDKILQPCYSLGDQLLVDPDPRLPLDAKARAQRIEMTTQEVAVALSHIQVWKLIAAGDVPYTLVLEDDVYFRHGFARSLDAAWLALMRRSSGDAAFDLLYLSFKETGSGSQVKKETAGPVRRPEAGLWQASGYVLSQAGAGKLLESLPAHGPVDLWLNLQFGALDVFTTRHSIIEQRTDVPSTNSYSVMPVLSQVGVYTREKPLVARAQDLPEPVVAYGEPGSGLTALAMALSVLGYTCCSDIRELPAQEDHALLEKRRDRRFNAYVNIGSLGIRSLLVIADRYPKARFIFTARDGGELLHLDPGRSLYLPDQHPDKWSALSAFLEREYPALPYPKCNDIGQRVLTARDNKDGDLSPFERLKFDSSPWIVPSKAWRGVAVAETGTANDLEGKPILTMCGGAVLDESRWKLRDDTFPSNLAIFMPGNCTVGAPGATRLTLRQEATSVRSMTSAAIASRQKFLYGTFSAKLRPSNVSGLVTGMFLHRNGPRQEIDIEFLGNDTTKMLINVYYNPGTEGTKLEYGYRGTPVLVDLGFDAAEYFHVYEIEWRAHAIRWRVDGHIVHERVLWEPTPIPHLPMEFNVNLWHSRSEQLAGKLNVRRLPAYAEIEHIQINRL